MSAGTVAQLTTFHSEAWRMAATHLEHLTRLNTRDIPSIRKTGIICTIGPSCNTVETIREMIMNGMNIARINCSHGDRESHIQMIRAVKEAREALPDHYTAIALDTKGPEIRTGPIEGDGFILLKEKDKYTVTIDESGTKHCEQGKLFVDYPFLLDQLSQGQDLFIDDGILCLRVDSKSTDSLECRVVTGGKLYGKKGVNLPSVRIRLPIISPKDIEDLQLAMDEGVDMIFLSYVRNALEVGQVRKALEKSRKRILIISKFENEDSLTNMEELITSSDGVIIARGPLGVETPSAKVAVVQKIIVSKCNLNGKPVIVATQMLESMVTNPRATRAECSDVANAVLDGADCLMLSAETASGHNPIQAVRVMHAICAEAETAYYRKWLMQDLRRFKKSVTNLEAIAAAASTAVTNIHASAIVLVTTSGRSAEVCAQFRPPVPIIALCCKRHIARQLHLFRGILPFYFEDSDFVQEMDKIEEMLGMGIEKGKRRGFIRSADPVVLITGWPGDKLSFHSMMQVVYAK